VSERARPAGPVLPMATPGQDGPAEQTPLDPAKQAYKEGRALLKKEQWALAAQAFHEALQGFEKQEDRQGIANASDRLGDCCLADGEYDRALEHYRRAYRICEAEGDDFSLQSLHRKMAEVHRRRGDYAEAHRLLDAVLEHHRRMRDPKGAVETLETIAGLYEEEGRTQDAADTLRTIASIHANFKHQRTAQRYLERAEELERRG